MTATSVNLGGDSFQRIEVITGVARRRRWSSDDKARIVVESLAPGASVLAVCRRYRLNPNQLYGWRRQFRADDRPDDRSAAVTAQKKAASAAPLFAPVVVDEAPPRGTRPGIKPGTIEVAIGGVVVRLDGPVDEASLRQVLDVVRRLG